jgi:hypothetical protein
VLIIRAAILNHRYTQIDFTTSNRRCGRRIGSYSRIHRARSDTITAILKFPRSGRKLAHIRTPIKRDSEILRFRNVFFLLRDELEKRRIASRIPCPSRQRREYEFPILGGRPADLFDSLAARVISLFVSLRRSSSIYRKGLVAGSRIFSFFAAYRELSRLLRARACS